MEQKYYTNERAQQIVISLLKAHNIKKIIASPGTTNLTLVASLQQDSYFEIYSAADERSAAYLACGLAAESGEPVVLSCTGATASRNYLPALTEAYYRKLPVLAITATQNEYKIGHQCAQVIDRNSVPNDAVNLSVHVSTVRNADDEWHAEIEINKALLELRHNGGGPVHINLETTYSRDYSIKELPAARVINRITCSDTFPELPSGKIAISIESHRTMEKELTEAIDAFCASNNAVVFCDHISGYKGKYRIQSRILNSQRDYSSGNTHPDLVIHIGEVGSYSLVSGNEVWRVSADGKLCDPTRKLRYVFEMPETVFFRHYVKETQSDDSYLKSCLAEENVISEKIAEKVSELPFSNIWTAAYISPKLPQNSVLHMGILNTIRSWQFFEIPDSVYGYCNTGGFGIDGDVSSLIGASLANPNKLYFGIVGDLAFFYDMNVLGNRHVGNNVRIMLVNNGRGTEFTNYDHPGAAFGNAADAYIAAAGHYGKQSHDLIKHYAEDLGYEYLSASNKDEFLSVYERFLTPEITDKPILFEIFTDSKDESDALYAIRSCVSNASGFVLRKGMDAAKHVLGDAGFQKAVSVGKKILNR